MSTGCGRYIFFLGLQYLVRANFQNTSLSTQCAVRRLILSVKSYNLLFFVQGECLSWAGAAVAEWSVVVGEDRQLDRQTDRLSDKQSDR